MNVAINLVIGALALVGLGLFSLLTTRHLIKLIVALQLMSKGALLLLISAGYISGHLQLAQSLALTAIVVDTLTTVIALAFAIRVQQKFNTLDVRELGSLKG